ncbi:carboxymuconolactone decarboxylase family protein [Streptomyces tsukubensis]|uniref:Alkylhydroperoxidase n=1 Tax=Streptomyces tsukubensis TaxID=83656 RepID=A0A1V4A452_9ACTN|nr:carboxymuconolactone decarboxylase family protein [Streptomyces tsukubensis]OON74417.1 alkylhydroperoxidase [Streptomyces tsukubensis]QFR95343.1 carboxymuconolactone decarboxylase family protein [Streptomyces tsukubensis]
MTTNENVTDTTGSTGTGAGAGTSQTPGGALLPEHTPRLHWAKLAPDVYKAMAAFEQSAGKGLDPTIGELVRIRASQINHCAFCVDMHTKDALAAGETTERIFQLSAWEESKHFYTAKEIAAIELTEAITLLTDGFVPDEVYARAAEHFEESELTRLIAAVVAINAWNRFAVSTRMVPGHYKAQAPAARG